MSHFEQMHIAAEVTHLQDLPTHFWESAAGQSLTNLHFYAQESTETNDFENLHGMSLQTQKTGYWCDYCGMVERCCVM